MRRRCDEGRRDLVRHPPNRAVQRLDPGDGGIDTPRVPGTGLAGEARRRRAALDRWSTWKVAIELGPFARPPVAAGSVSRTARMLLVAARAGWTGWRRDARRGPPGGCGPSTSKTGKERRRVSPGRCTRQGAHPAGGGGLSRSTRRARPALGALRDVLGGETADNPGRRWGTNRNRGWPARSRTRGGEGAWRRRNRGRGTACCPGGTGAAGRHRGQGQAQQVHRLLEQKRQGE